MKIEAVEQTEILEVVNESATGSHSGNGICVGMLMECHGMWHMDHHDLILYLPGVLLILIQNGL